MGEFIKYKYKYKYKLKYKFLKFINLHSLLVVILPFSSGPSLVLSAQLSPPWSYKKGWFHTVPLDTYSTLDTY